MIAKIQSGKNFTGLINYNEIKVESNEGQLLVRENMPNYTGHVAARFLEKIGMYSRVKEQVFHVSLSFSEEDKEKLDNSTLIEIGKKYMTEIGMSKHPYMVYRHDDTAHPHMHIVGSKINPETQNKVIEKNIRYRSKRITSALEKEYGLTRTRELGSSIVPKKYNEVIKKEVEKALIHAPTTFKQLNKRLSQNHSSYRVKENRGGIVFHQVDPQGKQNSPSWKGSSFKNLGIDKKGLLQIFEANQKQASYIRTAVRESLATLANGQGTKIPIATFENKLLNKGIEVKYNIGQQGKIYGLAFQFNHKIFKASSIERAFSWNNMKAKLDMPEDMQLREALKANVMQQEHIHIEVDTQNRFGNKLYLFRSLNQVIEEGLNTMNQQQALDLAQNNNHYVEQEKQDGRELEVEGSAEIITEYKNDQAKGSTPPTPLDAIHTINSQKLIASLSAAETDRILSDKNSKITKKRYKKGL